MATLNANKGVALSCLKPVGTGLLVTLAQIAMAVLMLSPEGSFSFRYATLIQHDGFWFANIVDRGFQTTVPPIDHKVMEVSNVGFFPAYPAIAALVRYGLGFDTKVALLVTAQLAAFGFWSYFFLFCRRWEISPTLQFFGALSILAHPAAFFLIAGYSESLFLMALLGFVYWTTAEGRAAKFLAAAHGMIMSATRIVGILCTAFPVVNSVFAKGMKSVRPHLPAVAAMIVATLGAGLFFLYCQLRWGHWDMYMLTQWTCWAIEPDYLAAFRPSTYHWLVPALNYPTEISQMATTMGGLLLVALGLCEAISAVRRHTQWQSRAGLYFCALLIYYISVSGVASVQLESMLRYEFCVHALIVLAFLHFLRQFRLPSPLMRTVGMATVALAAFVGLSVQSWFVWNFTRGNWVA